MHMRNPLFNDDWINVYQKYLERYSHTETEKRSENRIQLENNNLSKKFITESHNLFFYNALNTLEAKRPVQNIYKRPI